MTRVEQALHATLQGDAAGKAELLTLVYDRLRDLAARKLARETPGQTLQATALVHEAWLKLAGSDERHWQGRTHFYAAAAEAMRRILIDRARRKRAARHGGGWRRLELIDLAGLPGADNDPDEALLRLDEALERLAAVDPAKARLVELRFFGGMTLEEAAEASGVSSATAKRHWAFARAWLFREMQRLHPGAAE